MKQLALAIVFALTTQVPSASLVVTKMFQEEGQQIEFVRTPGESQYLFFQPTRDTYLNSISIFGEPLTHILASEMRWSLFRTTATWDTPNGNDDCLFHEWEIIGDNGRGEYLIPVSVPLKADGYYRLTFQISNLTWSQPHYAIPENGAPFYTENEEFLIHGFGGSFNVPGTRRIAAISFHTETVPEPSNMALSGVGFMAVFIAQWLRRAKRRS